MDHETQEGPSVAVQLEVNDLKAKVFRLTEQVTEHTAKVNFFSVMSEKVDLMEQQIHRWRYRLPDLTDDESREPIVSAVEVQEALDKFKDLTMITVREVREDHLFQHRLSQGSLHHHLRTVALAQRMSAQCEAKFEQKQSGLTSLTLNNGQLECESKKQGKCGISEA